MRATTAARDAAARGVRERADVAARDAAEAARAEAARQRSML